MGVNASRNKTDRVGYLNHIPSMFHRFLSDITSDPKPAPMKTAWILPHLFKANDKAESHSSVTYVSLENFNAIISIRLQAT